MTDLEDAVRLFSPLLLGFVCHGLCIKAGFLASLARPLDRGACLRGRRLFGENKTWRGLVVVALGTGLGFAAMGRLPFATGVLVGAAAMAAELPNSLVKRQLDIAPGAQAGGLTAVVFHVIDQVDVVAGAWVVLAFVVRPTASLVLASVAFVFIAHQALTALGYVLGMRATWR